MIYRGVFLHPHYNVDEVELHSGGEGSIHRIVGQPGLVAKIYHKARLSSSPTARNELKEKLIAMVNTPLQTQEDGNLLYAWPHDLLFSDNDPQFWGYVMPLVDDTSKPLLSALRLNEREQIQPNYSTLWSVLLARNLASVVDRAHAAGILVGDFQPLNQLVSPQATVTMIDCDSFGIRENTGRWFPPVSAGVATYLAPELLRSRSFEFSIATDRYSLAVEIFMILFNGCHPYCANGVIEENVKNFMCPYFLRGQDDSLPAEAPNINWVGPRLKKYFERALIGSAQQRPTAEEWRLGLEDLLTKLSQPTARCSMDPKHRFVREYTPSGCPWCTADNRLKKRQRQFRRPAVTPPRWAPSSPPPHPASATSTGTRIFQNANPAFKRLSVVHAGCVWAFSFLLPALVSQTDAYERLYVDSGLELFPGFSDLVLILSWLLVAKGVRTCMGPVYQKTKTPVMMLLKSIGLLFVGGVITTLLAPMVIGLFAVLGGAVLSLVNNYFAALAFVVILVIFVKLQL